MGNAIKRYSHNMVGIPALADEWGSLTTMLDAVLVNGFNPRVPTSITRVDTTVTVEVAGHGYVVGQWIESGGADQAPYNGEHKVTYATTGSYSYELPAGVTPPSPATTSTAFSTKVAPLGFEILHTGTHRRAYRTKDTLYTNRPVLRVDDGLTFSGDYGTDWAKYAKVTISQDASDVDTFIGVHAPWRSDHPDANEQFVPGTSGTSIMNGIGKWYWCRNVGYQDYSTGAVPAQAWDIVGDSRGFYFLVSWNDAAYGRHPYSFGDFDSFVPSDGFNSMIAAATQFIAVSGAHAYPGYYNMAQTNNYQCRHILSDHTGSTNGEPGAIMGMNFGVVVEHVSGYHNLLPYPNPSDYSLVLTKAILRGQRSGLRGIVPGLYLTPHYRPLPAGSVVKNVPSLPGREFLCFDISIDSSSAPGQFYIDLTGPWRAQ